MDAVRPIMIALVSANAINALADWVFVYGHWGMPALGVHRDRRTRRSRRAIYLAAALFVVIVRRERATPSGLHDVPLDVRSRAHVAALLRLGMPAAMQITLEVGVFAHGVGACRAASRRSRWPRIRSCSTSRAFVFMVPLGLSSAAAVRVGPGVGRGDAAGVRRAGWAALGVAGAFGVAASACSRCGRGRCCGSSRTRPRAHGWRRSVFVVGRAVRAVRCRAVGVHGRACAASATRARRWSVNLGRPLAASACRSGMCCASTAAGAWPGSGPGSASA